MAKPKKSTDASTKPASDKQPMQWQGWKLDLIAVACFYVAMAALFYPIFFL